jgi:hypothetical protein
MNRAIARDAVEIRNEIRKTEAAFDEALLQSARLIQRVVQGRQNPDLPPDTCQAAIARISRAQQQMIESSSEVFRAHAELGKVARELGLGDESPTVPGASEPTGLGILEDRYAVA